MRAEATSRRAVLCGLALTAATGIALLRPRIASGVSAISMLGIVVPSATPRELVQRISADIAREVKSSTLTTQLQELGTDPVASDPEAYDAKIREEIEKWSKVVRTARITVD